MGWSDLLQDAKIISGDVSIPERVWGGLEPVQKLLGLFLRLVSIPERVWGGLERDLHLRGLHGN